MFAFAPARPSRRPSLTPMIDVVFLLLIFFMLAARFGQDGALDLATGGVEVGYSGPPRLVGIGVEAITLNGRPMPLEQLAEALVPLTASPGDTIVLRAREGVVLQRLIDVAEDLRAAGFTALAVVD